MNPLKGIRGGFDVNSLVRTLFHRSFAIPTNLQRSEGWLIPLFVGEYSPEMGKGTLKVMRRIKKEMDPLNLLNPGKILFEEGTEEWK